MTDVGKLVLSGTGHRCQLRGKLGSLRGAPELDRADKGRKAWALGRPRSPAGAALAAGSPPPSSRKVRLIFSQTDRCEPTAPDHGGSPSGRKGGGGRARAGWGGACREVAPSLVVTTSLRVWALVLCAPELPELSFCSLGQPGGTQGQHGFCSLWVVAGPLWALVWGALRLASEQPGGVGAVWGGGGVLGRWSSGIRPGLRGARGLRGSPPVPAGQPLRGSFGTSGVVGGTEVTAFGFRLGLPALPPPRWLLCVTLTQPVASTTTGSQET